jgi:hypothetical protein
MDAPTLRAEDCRFAILKALAQRAEGAHTAEAVKSVYLTHYDFTQQEVNAALALLETGELVRKIKDASGLRTQSTWQITLKGNAEVA